ncbi:MAG TPA: rhomboid family intramembrane serine protease [Chthoniobacterales bacterium]|nr:rhomboid family intramembrane serine protease [Chthoniobacterales bacterium]
MFGVTTSDDYRPVTWMGRYPVDVTAMLVGVHVVCAIVTAFLFAIGHAGILDYATFDSGAIVHGQVWRLFTYAFIHQPSGGALLLFAIEMYMLFFFGREVERFLGRRSYIWLYGLLLVVPVLILEAWGLLHQTRTGFSGSAALHFAVFAAFVTIYPNVQFFLRIPAKWVFLIFAAIATLSGLAAHDWQDLLVLWDSIAVAFIFIELRGAGPELAWVNNFKARFRPKPKLYVVQKTSTRPTEPDDVYASVDPILDKISKSGIGSLTETERKILDRARKRLLKNSD